MIGIDTNVLIAASVLEHEKHAAVANWLQKDSDSFTTTLVNVGEYLRLVTHPRVFSKPLKLTKAIETLNDFLEYYQIRVLGSEVTWWQEGVKLLPSGIAGNSVLDFQIAYTFYAHGIKKIATFDKGFKRFDFITTVKLP